MKKALFLLLLPLFITSVHAASGWYWIGSSFPWAWHSESKSWYYFFVPDDGLEVVEEDSGASVTFPPEESAWIYVDSNYPLFWLNTADTFLRITSPTGYLETYSQSTGQTEYLGYDAKANAIINAVKQAREDYDLTGAVFSIWQNGEELVTGAVGETLTNVPATTQMYFRTGGPCINVLMSVLLQAVDDGKVSLDDTVDQWYPDLVNADKVTLMMLANCTAGYKDYVFVEAFQEDFYDDAFRYFSSEELIQYSMDNSPTYEPGTDWGYSHTTFVILGEILQQVYEQPMATIMREQVFEPLSVESTRYITNPQIPSPVLNAYTTERGLFENSTYWNPSWTSYTGQMVSQIRDIAVLAQGIFSDTLITQKSFDTMIAPLTVGLGPNTESRYYAMGIGVVNGWVLQNPSFGGYQGVMAYNLNDGTTIAVYCTLGEDSDPDTHYATLLYQDLREILE